MPSLCSVRGFRPGYLPFSSDRPRAQTIPFPFRPMANPAPDHRLMLRTAIRRRRETARGQQVDPDAVGIRHGVSSAAGRRAVYSWFINQILHRWRTAEKLMLTLSTARWDDAGKLLLAPPATTVVERAGVNCLRARLSRARRKYETAIWAYRLALQRISDDAWCHAEPAHACLATLDIDENGRSPLSNWMRPRTFR
jgi:hypothetical protein